jgi:hypothetical protein
VSAGPGLNALLTRLWSEGYVLRRIEDTGRRGPKTRRWFLGDGRRAAGNTPQETRLHPVDDDENVSADDENVSADDEKDAPGMSESCPNQSELPSLSNVGPISEPEAREDDPELPQEAK